MLPQMQPPTVVTSKSAIQVVGGDNGGGPQLPLGLGTHDHAGPGSAEGRRAADLLVGKGLHFCEYWGGAYGVVGQGNTAVPAALKRKVSSRSSCGTSICMTPMQDADQQWEVLALQVAKCRVLVLTHTHDGYSVTGCTPYECTDLMPGCLLLFAGLLPPVLSQLICGSEAPDAAA